jgi:drug/metabolite transporter (DMT)-like permease
MSANHKKIIHNANISGKKYFMISRGLVLSSFFQQVGLPIFIGSFGRITGPYFVVLISSILFNIIFWPIIYFRTKSGKITEEMTNYKKHWKLILIGVFDALNGILIVFSSALERTPGALQAILIQTIIPLTIISSKLLLKKKYTMNQLVGGGVCLMGCIVSLIPKFENPEIGNFNLIYPALFLLGCFPAVLMNIFEEHIFEDIHNYDVYLMLGWESLYQLVTVVLFFWTDIIPGFGMSADINIFLTNLSNGFVCYFYPWGSKSDKCKFCFITKRFQRSCEILQEQKEASYFGLLIRLFFINE